MRISLKVLFLVVALYALQIMLLMFVWRHSQTGSIILNGVVQTIHNEDWLLLFWLLVGCSIGLPIAGTITWFFDRSLDNEDLLKLWLFGPPLIPSLIFLGITAAIKHNRFTYE